MNSELVIGIASTVVACIALFIAVWEARLSRRHNRLSLVPHLSITTQYSDVNPRFRASVENTGVGPAVIDAFGVFVDGREHKPFEPGIWLAILDLVGIDGRAKGLYIQPGEFLPVGKELSIVECEVKDLNRPIGEIRRAIERIRVRIAYSSVYGEQKVAEFSQEVSIFDCYETGEKDL